MVEGEELTAKLLLREALAPEELVELSIVEEAVVVELPSRGVAQVQVVVDVVVVGKGVAAAVKGFS